jgi:hypothetical protein
MMGYPMTWSRVVCRNNLQGDYDNADPLGYIKGDLRRFERDQQDDTHVKQYVEASGATEEQVRKILSGVFGIGPMGIAFKEWSKP